MARRHAILPGLLLAALVACGGPTSTTGNQAITAPTATVTGTQAAVAPTANVAPPASGPASGAPAARTPAPAAAPGAASGATPTPRAGTTAMATAAPTSRPPSPAVAATPQPTGPIPAGWKVYRGGPEFPFVVAYPPDWTLDDSFLPEQKIIFLFGPGDREDGERIDIAFSETGNGANIDVQRDEFFREESEFCERKGIEYTAHRQIAGATFAILGATCDASNTLSFMQVASGLKEGDEWNILMRTPYDRKEARLREVFDPLLASLNIYAKVP